MIPICAGTPAESASDLPEVEASWRGWDPGCPSADAGDKSPTPVSVSDSVQNASMKSSAAATNGSHFFNKALLLL